MRWRRAASAERIAAAVPLFDRLHAQGRALAEPPTRRVRAGAAARVRRSRNSRASMCSRRTRPGLIIVDMHAAHERITYEKLKTALATKGLQSRRLLVPISFEVSAREADLIEQFADDLAAVGLEMVRRGPQHVAVSAVPLLLEGEDVEPMVRDLLSDLGDGQGVGRVEALATSCWRRWRVTPRFARTAA